MIRRSTSLLIISSTVLLVTACADLSAVRDWSKTSFEATQYNELITTYADTPQRIKRYELWCDQTSFCKTQLYTKNKLTREEILKLYNDQIKLRENQKEALQRILSVISDYMATLAVLSADSTVDYEKDIDSVTQAIGKLNAGISQDTLGATGSLVKIILGTAAKAYQAKQVSYIVEQANPPLQTILNSELRHIVNSNFRRELKIEKAWIDRYYDYLRQKDCTLTSQKGAFNEASEKHKKTDINRSDIGGNCLPDAINMSIEEWKEEHLNQNEKREKAIEAYLVILDNLATGHQKLFDNRNKLDNKKVIKDLYYLVNELNKQIKTLSQS